MSEFATTSVLGRVFDIQRASFNDGPGLRTTVFLRGCPLRCAWCHNPESWRMTARPGEKFAEPMTVEQVMSVVRADAAYYEGEGEEVGGLTVSGGEPTVQAGFLIELLKAARREGIHTCLDTCGDSAPEVLAEVHPWVCLYLFDLKLPDDASYRALTGRGESRILANLDWVLGHGGRVRLRCPILPGVNDTDEHFARIRFYAHRPGVVGVDLMPYHPTGEHKWEREAPGRAPLRARVPTEEELEGWRRRVTG